MSIKTNGTIYNNEPKQVKENQRNIEKYKNIEETCVNAKNICIEIANNIKIYKHQIFIGKQDIIDAYITVLNNKNELINDIDKLILNINKIITVCSVNVYNDFSVNNFSYYEPNDQVIFSGFHLYKINDKYTLSNNSQYYDKNDDFIIKDTIETIYNYDK